MDHRVAASRLSDLVLGAVQEQTAPDIWAHVGGCHECQQVLAAMWFVRRAGNDEARLREGSPEPGVLPEPAGHPRPEVIVAHALGDDELDPAERSNLLVHLAHCPECRRDVEVTKRAEAHARRPWRFLDRLWRPPILEGRALGWATAGALAVLLAYPSYLGILELPSLRRVAADQERDLKAARAHEITLEQADRNRHSAPVAVAPSRLLILRAATRGPESGPVLTLVPGQIYQPLVLDYDIGRQVASDPDSRVELRLTRLPDPAPIWRQEFVVSQLWDQPNQVVSLLTPAALLTPGAYRVELRDPGSDRARFAARFTVARSGTPVR